MWGGVANRHKKTAPLPPPLREARTLVNEIRSLLGLGPFPPEHGIHTTLCKVTGRGGEHAALRARLKGGWPIDGRFPKKLRSLAEAM